MMKRNTKRSRPEDGGSPSADAGNDFDSKTREFLTLCERTSLDLQETRARLKATMELVEQKNKELGRQKAAHDAAIETESDTIRELSEERDDVVRSRHALVEELRTFKLRSAGDAEMYRKLAEQRLDTNTELMAINRELVENVRKMGEESRFAIVTERTAVEKLTAERNALKDILESAKETFTDCITLTTSPGVLLTSGQMLTLDGLVGMWLNSPRFNGDIWFPFQCPLTNKTTTPVRDMSECGCFFGARPVG